MFSNGKACVQQSTSFLITYNAKEMNKASARKISRRKKKYWRKGANISDVETFLDDIREQERLHGCQLHLKKDEDLFEIDKTPGSTIDFSIKADDFDSQTASQSVKASNRFNRKQLKKLQSVSVRRKKYRRKKSGICFSKRTFYDIWATPVSKYFVFMLNLIGEKAETSELDDSLVEHYLRETKKLPVKVPNTRNIIVSTCPHVQSPHEGTSYNPTEEAHQDLLIKAYEEEKTKLEANVWALNAMKVPKNEQMATEESRLKEMMQGLVDESDKDGASSGDEASVEEKVQKRKTVCEKRKTVAQRKRQLNLKKAEQRKCFEKKMRMYENEIHRIKSINKEIKRMELNWERRAEIRKRRMAEKLKKPAKLGRHPFIASDREVLLPEELPDSLRLLKPEGHILTDRFKSLQQRNILEPRVRCKIKRKYKRKRFNKKGVSEVDASYIPR
ncbi:Glioma tumor suppressor candidate region protein [Trichinella pseudospiralis]|uniref:Ribosome biogenesis protein NOP53 n=1 Tax=Trichinella pseudospiralis TaxID=6337 RepID=A0A0V1EPN7_TRIPS|nr:Glioma tumor suppressor candidate region protein [Trichinella pseudospiralis]